MQRIEPTIGTFSLEADPAADAQARAQARSKRLRHAIAHWSVTLLLFAGTIGACYAGASYAGILPEQLRLGTPSLLARLLIIAGFAIVFGSQIIGSLLLFRYSFERGALTLLFPGYLLIGLKRSGIYWQVMGPWCMGFLLVVVGTVLLSYARPNNSLKRIAAMGTRAIIRCAAAAA
jgi:hypothetical protein